MQTKSPEMEKVSILDDALYSNDDFISPLTAVQSLKIETDEPEESDSVDVLNVRWRDCCVN